MVVDGQAPEPLRLRALEAFMSQLPTSMDPALLSNSITFMLSQIKVGYVSGCDGTSSLLHCKP